jgi:hypothetical protein
MPNCIQAKVKSSQSLLFPLAFAPPPFHSSPAALLPQTKAYVYHRKLYIRLMPKCIQAKVRSSQFLLVPLTFAPPPILFRADPSTEKYIPAHAVVGPGKSRIASIPPASPAFAPLRFSADQPKPLYSSNDVALIGKSRSALIPPTSSTFAPFFLAYWARPPWPMPIEPKVVRRSP